MAERGARQAQPNDSPAPKHAWPGDSVGYLVWRSYLVFRRAFDDGLAELDVTMAQVGLAGELMVRGPRTVADLARVIGITPQGAALAVAHLRKIGWVSESQAKGRGRSILLEITDKGRDGYLKAADIVARVDQSLTRGMTAGERKGTLSGLKVIAEARLPAAGAHPGDLRSTCRAGRSFPRRRARRRRSRPSCTPRSPG
jgi:DNA-binding MarR family transcriptional regulator